MQFDWMVACYPGDGVHRDYPMMAHLDRESVIRGVDAVVETGLELFGDEVMPEFT